MVSSYYSLDLIKSLMKRLNLSQAWLAEGIGMSRQAMCQLINGQTPIKKHHLLAMTYVIEKYMEANDIIFNQLSEQIIMNRPKGEIAQ